mmetsp:Transcript_3178/g.3785  ORF Transcript_3178/g.3785 Transcript_3178/m.3785 type:complete len:456 (-) Transcript_3178:108-1475(-)
MPPRRRFDKKSAKTFSIVHRAHDDALYYDNEASEHVLVPTPGQENKHSRMNPGNKKKVYSTSDLENNLTPEEIEKIRGNEGLAAQFGIYFDDSKYDYMQHLKPIGETGDGVFIERKSDEKDKKRQTNIEDLFKDQLPSEQKVKITHDTFENIPLELKGFKPDMDPRLREVLEALEDEAYIESGQQDAEDDDIFASLINSGQVEDEDEFYYGSDADQYYDDEDYDEWDLDNYNEEYDAKYASDELEKQDMPYNKGEEPEDLVEEKPPTFLHTNWEKDFKKFKMDNKNKANDWDSDDEFEDEDEDVVPDLPSFNGNNLSNKKLSKTKLRKKKGAMTDTSSFSMSSSALFRTDGLTLLDDRYEQLAKKFEDEEDEDYQEFDMDKERGDLEGMLDDFLNNYELESGGRKLVKKDQERQKLQEAADSVSKGKLAARRKKEKQNQKDPLGSLGGSFGNLKI